MSSGDCANKLNAQPLLLPLLPDYGRAPPAAEWEVRPRGASFVQDRTGPQDIGHPCRLPPCDEGATLLCGHWHGSGCALTAVHGGKHLKGVRSIAGGRRALDGVGHPTAAVRVRDIFESALGRRFLRWKNSIGQPAATSTRPSSPGRVSALFKPKTKERHR